MSEIRTLGFRQSRNPNASLDFSAFRFWTFGIFLGHTKCLYFSMFGFQTVSEIQKFEHVPLASTWLATGFLVLF